MVAEIYKLLYAKEFYQIVHGLFDTLEKKRDKLLIKIEKNQEGIINGKINWEPVTPYNLENFFIHNLKDTEYDCVRWNSKSKSYQNINNCLPRDSFEDKKAIYIIYKNKETNQAENKSIEELIGA
jgi:hypothetical protein